MTSKDDYIIFVRGSKKSKLIFWFFFGIIAFLAIYFPFLAPNLRFQTGAVLSKVFNTLGTIMVTLGVLMFVFGLLSLFCGRTASGVKVMLLGAIMMFLGGHFLYPAIIGAGSTGKEIPQGYH